MIPCSCCPTGPPRCALVGQRFTGVAETVPQAGWNQVSLPATIDGITATNSLSGYTTTIGNTPSAALEVTYTHTTPQNRVRGLMLWNQAGGDLTDADGLGAFTADFYAGAVLLTTFNTAGVNGGARQSLLFPGGATLTGVDRVVLRSLSKQIGGSVAPLWRELQLAEIQAVFPCRRRNGILEWYDVAGVLVPSADLVPCPA